MAYLDQDDFLTWMLEPLPDEIPADSYLRPEETDRESEDDVAEPEASCGFIFQDWFGPFLFGPYSRCRSGRC